MASTQCSWFWKTCRLACLRLQWHGLQLTVGLQSLTLGLWAWLLGWFELSSSNVVIFHHFTWLSFFSFINCFPGDWAWKAGSCATNKPALHTSSRRSTAPASLERCCWWYLLPRISASSWANGGEIAWSSERHNDQNSDWHMQSQHINPSCIGHSLQL